MKQLYNKITGQAESLKGLWVAKLNLKGRSALATEHDLEDYNEKKAEVSTTIVMINKCVFFVRTSVKFLFSFLTYLF